MHVVRFWRCFAIIALFAIFTLCNFYIVCTLYTFYTPEVACPANARILRIAMSTTHAWVPAMPIIRLATKPRPGRRTGPPPYSTTSSAQDQGAATARMYANRFEPAVTARPPGRCQLPLPLVMGSHNFYFGNSNSFFREKWFLSANLVLRPPCILASKQEACASVLRPLLRRANLGSGHILPPRRGGSYGERWGWAAAGVTAGPTWSILPSSWRLLSLYDFSSKVGPV